VADQAATRKSLKYADFTAAYLLLQWKIRCPSVV